MYLKLILHPPHFKNINTAHLYALLTFTSHGDKIILQTIVLVLIEASLPKL